MYTLYNVYADELYTGTVSLEAYITTHPRDNRLYHISIIKVAHTPASKMSTSKKMHNIKIRTLEETSEFRNQEHEDQNMINHEDQNMRGKKKRYRHSSIIT